MKRIFLLLFLVCYIGSTASAQTLSASFETVLSIGGENTNEAAYLFRNPTGIKTDRQGTIYISDQNSSSIKKFNPSGEYIGSIGQKGRGPGEFQEITAFHVTNDGEILIFDHRSQRFSVISNSISDPESVSGMLLDDNEYIKIHSIHESDSSSYYINYTDDSTFLDRTITFNKLSDFSLTKSVEVADEGFFNFEEPFNQAALLFSSFNFLFSGQSLYITPRHSAGRILKVDLETNKQSTLQGKQPTLPNFKYVDESYINRERSNMSLYSGKAGRFISKIYNVSLGVFEFNDNLIEFVFMDTDKNLLTNDIIFGVNRFSKDGEFIGFYEIPEYSNHPNESFFLKVLWKDEQDNFYIVDNSGFSKIKVMKLTFID